MTEATHYLAFIIQCLSSTVEIDMAQMQMFRNTLP